MQGWKRAINTISVRTPQAPNTNPLNERRESANSAFESMGEQHHPSVFVFILIYMKTPQRFIIITVNKTMKTDLNKTDLLIIS